MNVHAATIPDTEEAWEERTLGADEKFVEVVGQAEDELINEAAGTQLISIRMSKCMIDDFKMIASLNGSIGYQTLMKQVLQRFVDSEKKRILRELVSEKLKEHEPKPKAAAATTEPSKRKAQQKKAA